MFVTSSLGCTLLCKWQSSLALWLGGRGCSCRSLGRTSLEEAVKASLISFTLAIFELFETVLDLDFLESFLSNKELFESIFVRLVPLDLSLEGCLIIFNMWVLEQLSGCLKAEILRNLILFLLLGVLIFLVNPLDDGLNILTLFHVLECLDWSNTWDVGCVIAPAKNAKIDKLLLGHVEAFQNLGEFNLKNRLLFAVEASEQEVSAKCE